MMQPNKTQQADVTVYLTATCPYCIRAMRLLQHKEVSVNQIRVDLQPARRQEMQQKSNRHTVPQIFINGVSVGGYDDIAALDRAGKLDGLLWPSNRHNEER